MLTLLIHLGYLTWDEGEETARIPNEEIQTEFRKILKDRNVNQGWLKLLSHSQKLLEDTIAGKATEVAEAIDLVRQTQYAPAFYNVKQSKALFQRGKCEAFSESTSVYVIKFAYIAAIDQYLKVEELPSGKGIADVVYLPKKKSLLPALVVELKWDKTAGGALEQIKDRNYPAILQEYGGEIVMVGINHDSKTRVHTCQIERI